MARRNWVLAIALSAMFVVPVTSPLRAADSTSDRTVVSKVEPEYPELARRARITGSVRVEAVVAPNGTIRSVKVLGGHPLLGQAAQDAMRKWRYAPATSESTVVVVFNFNHA
jgi:TonB family protein